MKKEDPIQYRIHSISQQHQLLSLPGPDHPLVSVINFADIKQMPVGVSGNFSTDFYTVSIKKKCTCKMRYGQHYYDFDQGIMSFFAPGQMLYYDASSPTPPEGWLLCIHADFLVNHPMGQKIKEYGFFSYALSEALHLSPKEEKVVEGIMKNIRQECRSVIDDYTQDVIVAHIELMLNYANRFYNRQFITRKSASNDLLVNLEELLTKYINSEKIREDGVPTVRYISEQLNISPNYLGDLLKKATGLTTQQHIHNVIIEKAKEILSSTNLSVSEIAYDLGFEYPQSFSKLFKQKTNLSPLGFRNSFN